MQSRQLTLDAVAAGALTYDNAKIYEPKWQRRKYWLLLAYYRRQQIEWRKIRSERIASLLTIPEMPRGDLFNVAEKLSNELYELIFGEQPTKPDPLQDSQSQWERGFGCRLDDPETQRNIDLVCQGLEAVRETNRSTS